MPQASQAIFAANEAGRLGLVVYAIPNFPTPDDYATVLADLASRPAVSVLETTYPVADRYSEYANEIIRDAHGTALQYGDNGLAAIDHLQDFAKPKICVLYRATYEDAGLANIAASARGNLQGLLFEWELDTEEDVDGVLSNQGVEPIHPAGDYMQDSEVDQLLATVPSEALIYLESASMTGAQLTDMGDLQRFAQRLKARRPDLCLAAGFGIKTAEHVADFARIEEVDAVIIGTRFLEVIRLGAGAAADYLDGITQALER